MEITGRANISALLPFQTVQYFTSIDVATVQLVLGTIFTVFVEFTQETSLPSTEMLSQPSPLIDKTKVLRSAVKLVRVPSIRRVTSFASMVASIDPLISALILLRFKSKLVLGASTIKSKVFRPPWTVKAALLEMNRDTSLLSILTVIGSVRLRFAVTSVSSIWIVETCPVVGTTTSTL